jgi:hypothetical protein
MLWECCVPQVRLLWLIFDSNKIEFPLNLSPLCRNSSVICSKTTGLAVAWNLCHWLSTLYSSLVMWHCFMEVYETERWYRHNPVQLRNWTSNPKYFLYHHSGSVVSVLTLFVETLDLLLCKHGGAHSHTLCKCKIQVFALGFICSLHEQITSTVMIFDIPELMWPWKYAI